MKRLRPPEHCKTQGDCLKQMERVQEALDAYVHKYPSASAEADVYRRVIAGYAARSRQLAGELPTTPGEPHRPLVVDGGRV
jgi:hypothetical protein